MIRTGAETRTGLHHKVAGTPNEDGFLVFDKETLGLDHSPIVFTAIVIDGVGGEHDGRKAKEAIMASYKKILRNVLTSTHNFTPEVFKALILPNIFNALQQELVDHAQGGKAAAVVAFVTEDPTNGSRTLITGTVGDCQALVLRPGLGRVFINDQHDSISNSSEPTIAARYNLIANARTREQAIQAMGGNEGDYIFFTRIGNRIQNSLGDPNYHKNGIHTNSFELQPGDKVILSSDGNGDRLVNPQDLLALSNLPSATATELYDQTQLILEANAWRKEHDDQTSVCFVNLPAAEFFDSPLYLGNTYPPVATPARMSYVVGGQPGWSYVRADGNNNETLVFSDGTCELPLSWAEFSDINRQLPPETVAALIPTCATLAELKTLLSLLPLNTPLESSRLTSSSAHEIIRERLDPVYLTTWGNLQATYKLLLQKNTP